MSAIRLRSFAAPEALVAAAADVLEQHLTREFGRPHLVLLPGGNTPLPVYDDLISRRCRASEDVWIGITDERYVALESQDSNIGRCRRLIESIELPPERVLQVLPEGGLKSAAARYDRDLRQFVRNGGRLPLALLGLGSDGHTASLFNAEDLTRGQGCLAVAIPRKVKPDRISVTPDLLKRFETIIFLVIGDEKDETAARLLRDPTKVTAGLAVAGAPSVQLWQA